MQLCFWCHAVKNNRGSNPFCTNRCQIEHHRYELYINKLRRLLSLKHFRRDPRLAVKSHETITDKIWKEILA